MHRQTDYLSPPPHLFSSRTQKVRSTSPPPTNLSPSKKAALLRSQLGRFMQFWTVSLESSSARSQNRFHHGKNDTLRMYHTPTHRSASHATAPAKHATILMRKLAPHAHYRCVRTSQHPARSVVMVITQTANASLSATAASIDQTVQQVCRWF